MTLLDRYLHAIKPLLPRKLQDDVLRELSDEILSQVEEKEAALGRPLTEAEQEEVIKRQGHPVVVAARYGRAHYLIGPALFPFYWLILRIASVGALIVRWIIAMVTIASSPHPAEAIAPQIVAVPFVLIPVFAWVTGLFAIAQLCGSRFDFMMKAGWSPSSLPAVTKQPSDTSRTGSVVDIVFAALFILWWQSVPAVPYLALGRFLTLGPVWSTLHWPILLWAVAWAAQSAVNLARPQFTPARIAVRILTHVYGLVLACILLAAGNWIIASPELHNAAQGAKGVAILNQVFLYSIVCAIGILAVQIVVECRKYGRRFFHACGAQHALPKP